MLAPLAKEVVGLGPPKRRRAGAVTGRDMPSQAGDDGGRHAGCLIAREVGRRRGLVGDRDRRRGQLARLAIAPSAPIVKRNQAGAADRHIGLAKAPWSAEAVGDHDRGSCARGGQDLGPRRRAEASGSSGNSATRSSPGTFDVSMPAFAQTSPLRVSTMRMPRSARTTRALSSRISWISRGVLAELRREIDRPLAGLDPAEVAYPPLALRDHLLRDHQDIPVAGIGRGGEHRPERDAGLDLG